MVSTISTPHEEKVIFPGVSGEFFCWEGWPRGSEVIEAVPAQLKQRAVQMVADLRSDSVSEWQTMGTRWRVRT